MTKLLEQAFAEAAALPEHDQDVLAKALLDDLAAGEKWDDAFANSHDKLALLADEALAEFERRETMPQLNKKRPKFGSAKGSIQMSDDFNEPLQDFADEDEN